MMLNSRIERLNVEIYNIIRGVGLLLPHSQNKSPYWLANAPMRPFLKIVDLHYLGQQDLCVEKEDRR